MWLLLVRLLRRVLRRVLTWRLRVLVKALSWRVDIIMGLVRLCELKRDTGLVRGLLFVRLRCR